LNALSAIAEKSEEKSTHHLAAFGKTEVIQVFDLLCIWMERGKEDEISPTQTIVCFIKQVSCITHREYALCGCTQKNYDEK
jgi:hypothetical protein